MLFMSLEILVIPFNSGFLWLQEDYDEIKLEFKDYTFYPYPFGVYGTY